MSNEPKVVKCIDVDEEGKGIVKLGKDTFKIPNLLKGEKAAIEIVQRKNSRSAAVVKIIEKSEDRVKPSCTHYQTCGGCQLQHMNAKQQAAVKQKIAESVLKKYGKVNPIISMKEPFSYRNKVHSTFSRDKKGNVVSGIYQENSHKVVSVKRCMIQDERADKIIETIRQLTKKFKIMTYDEDRGQGFLRHVLIKTGFSTGQVMVVLVTSSQVFPGKKGFVAELLKAHPEITTIVMNINNRKTSVVLGNVEKVLYGKGYIEDTLCGCRFRISPKSFYQINPKQTEILYNTAIKMAHITNKETVLDAYCGIGTITLIAAKHADKVIGVELNKDAVRDAIGNAKLNKISNVYFYNEDAGEYMQKLSAENYKIDTVFMDPPRSGSDEKFLSSVVKLSPKKVVYISCNPYSLARDLKYLTEKGYKVNQIQPVDMFPQTVHVETVVLMSKVNTSKK